MSTAASIRPSAPPPARPPALPIDPELTPRRPLCEKPPESIERLLRSSGVNPDELLICTHSDIDRLGEYRRQWIAATNDRLFIIDDADAPRRPEIGIDIAIEDATSYRAHGGVGSGTLQAQIDGAYVDLIRYSNRRAFRFEKIARKLDRRLRGEPIRIHPDEEVDRRRCPSCGLLLEIEGESCPKCVSRGAVVKRMLNLVRPYRWPASLMMGLLLVGVALDLVSPQLTRYLVDHVLPGSADAAAALQRSPITLNEQIRLLAMVVAVLATVQVARTVVNLLNGRLSSRIGASITFDMRARLVQHLERLSIGFYDRQQVGSLVGRVAYDTEALHGFINQVTGGFLLQIIMLVGVGIMMFVTDAKLAMFTLIPAPLVVIGTIFFWRHIYPRNYLLWDSTSKQAGYLSSLLAGIRTVKAFNQEKRELHRFSRASARLRDSRRGIDNAMSTFNPIMAIVFQLGGWIVWYVGGRDVIGGRLTLGELMAFFGYLWMFYGPFGTLPQFTNWLTNFVSQAHRIFEILDTPAQLAEAAHPVAIAPVQGRIRFDRVTFGYERHTPVLRELEFEIDPGEFIGIVGHSGSGKSTIVNLICRFYDADEGRILIDNVDVREAPLNELRESIGVVLQEPFLFRGSVADNLMYGRPQATPEEMITASIAANCHEFIMRHSHAYDTWLGERGAGLSGGEKQRIGIGRVLLTDPRILILDEATSNIDAEAEAAIQTAMARLIRNRTTIAIAHRLSTIRHASRVFVIDQGQIVEQGAPDELIQAGGPFARMVQLQQGPGWRSGGDGEPDDHERRQGSDAARRNGEGRGADEHDHYPASLIAPQWLEPGELIASSDRFRSLQLERPAHGDVYRGAFALRCLPVKYERSYISLRFTDTDGHDQEIGLIRHLSDWPGEFQRRIYESLATNYFVHIIHGIEDIELIHNYLTFTVETDLGPQRFIMRWQSDRAQDHGEHGKMLIDTDDNRYLIPKVEDLPDRDRRLFRRYVYW